MSEDLLSNETHATNYRGGLKMKAIPYVEGEEIENFEAGQMVFDDTKNILYIYDGTAWFGSLTVVST